MGAPGHLGIQILEVLFFIGMAGSTILLILSAIEDIESWQTGETRTS
jgi:hypothetical protein